MSRERSGRYWCGPARGAEQAGRRQYRPAEPVMNRVNLIRNRSS